LVVPVAAIIAQGFSPQACHQQVINQFQSNPENTVVRRIPVGQSLIVQRDKTYWT